MQNVQWTIKKPSRKSAGFFVAHKGFLSNEIIEGMRILSDLYRHMADKGLIPATA